MARRRWVASLVVAGAAGAIAAACRRAAGTGAPARERIRGRLEPGGRVIPCARGYDAWSAILLGPLFGRVADDVAAVAHAGDALLEVGCGPGHLAILLAERGLHVTAADIDPAMVARTARNVERAFGPDHALRPTVMRADVARLPFEDGSFQLVVSTFSMHHWDDPVAGLTEIHRVLKPGGRALVWDFVPAIRRLEGDAVPAESVARASPFGAAVVLPLRWPWRLVLAERVELSKADRDGKAGD
jgi:SAM-dependent methyltransferase